MARIAQALAESDRQIVRPTISPALTDRGVRAPVASTVTVDVPRIKIAPRVEIPTPVAPRPVEVAAPAVPTDRLLPRRVVLVVDDDTEFRGVIREEIDAASDLYDQAGRAGANR